MKIKINWGWTMVIVMGLFMIFILQFVYRSIAVDTLQHHLVSEDYYKDELYYQQEIDKLNNASKLTKNVTVKRVDNGMQVTFPNIMEQDKIKGTIYFQRPSDKRIDFKQEIALTNNEMIIKNERLINGRWNIKIDWKYGDEEYLFKKNIFY
ncbi:FixH family protein [Aureibaculum sp. 2210JD6-5]|uniref:FixH family protein n=1 Tax=Aureibaculum sp. 2210JD6-5 TaxID=3103957 RepID=UPI002AAE6709|nr:FixH family protein [Aureibaculum sp. 2210JD6-5]MDY7396668.1 FixH family protein [Aureibaculum sp. 2210JD6-5]